MGMDSAHNFERHELPDLMGPDEEAFLNAPMPSIPEDMRRTFELRGVKDETAEWKKMVRESRMLLLKDWLATGFPLDFVNIYAANLTRLQMAQAGLPYKVETIPSIEAYLSQRPEVDNAYLLGRIGEARRTALNAAIEAFNATHAERAAKEDWDGIAQALSRITQLIGAEETIH